MSEYPEDEFDVAGRDRGPDGVHREPRSLLRALAPFLIVIVVAPLLAWGLVSLLSGGDGEQQAQDPPTEEVTETTPPAQEPTEEDETTEESTTEESTTEESTEDEGLGEDVVLTTSISVLNGAGVAGIAAEQAAVLDDAGFTSVGAADYTAGAPDVTTLYYRNADLAPTAEAIGELLGIDNLVELAGATQNVEVAIVLRSDFTD